MFAQILVMVMRMQNPDACNTSLSDIHQIVIQRLSHFRRMLRRRRLV
jgi:hypothetical protein